MREIKGALCTSSRIVGAFAFAVISACAPSPRPDFNLLSVQCHGLLGNGPFTITTDVKEGQGKLLFDKDGNSVTVTTDIPQGKTLGVGEEASVLDIKDGRISFVATTGGLLWPPVPPEKITALQNGGLSLISEGTVYTATLTNDQSKINVEASCK